METLTFHDKYPLKQKTFVAILGCLAAAGMAAIARSLRQAKQKEKEAVPYQQKFNGARDIVDEASWESFPASDPPAWTQTEIPKNII